MRLDVADDDIDAVGAHAARGLEHRVGLADAGACAEEDGSLPRLRAGLLGLDAREQLVGIGPIVVDSSALRLARVAT